VKARLFNGKTGNPNKKKTKIQKVINLRNSFCLDCRPEIVKSQKSKSKSRKSKQKLLSFLELAQRELSPLIFQDFFSRIVSLV
jgi:hypothetical protein